MKTEQQDDAGERLDPLAIGAGQGDDCASDDDVAPVLWLEAVTRGFAQGTGIQGALDALKEIEPEGACAAAYDAEAISKAAKDEIARFDAEQLAMPDDVRSWVRSAFQQIQQRLHAADRSTDLIVEIMEARGLRYEDYLHIVTDGQPGSRKTMLKLELMAGVCLPALLASAVPESTEIVEGGGFDEARRQPDPTAPDPKPEPGEGPDDGPPPWDAPLPDSLDDYDVGPAAKPARRKGAKTSTPPPEGVDGGIVDNQHFKVLGYYEGKIYVFNYRKKQVDSRGEADWPESALTTIAPLHWWELNFPGANGMSKKMAVNSLQQIAYARGIYDPDRQRGRGAWRDEGRFVFHFGDKLWVDGVMMDVTEIDSGYVYEQDRRLRRSAVEQLSAAEGRELYEAIQLFAWINPASAILLAGFIALAPIGGALRWRPHVWITGGAGSGKSTALSFLSDLMPPGLLVFAQGNSTEAGLRQILGTDSLPVLFDESESNNEREHQRIQNILSLIRQSSTESGARTFKGTPNGEASVFNIRSMFCLASIQVAIKQQADMERITVLKLRQKGSGASSNGVKAAEDWKRISAKLAAVRADPELPAKLLNRSLQLLPATIKNVDVFAQAAAEKFGSQRAGDQYGTLLAGAWSLMSDREATLDDARQVIEKYDWSAYQQDAKTEESDKALDSFMSKLVRAKLQDVSIHELLSCAAGRENIPGLSRNEANTIASRYGAKVDLEDRGRFVLFADRHDGRDALMEKTSYASDLKGQLERLPGAERCEKDRRFQGAARACFRVPVDVALGLPDAYLAGSPLDASLSPNDNWDEIPF